MRKCRIRGRREEKNVSENVQKVAQMPRIPHLKLDYSCIARHISQRLRGALNIGATTPLRRDCMAVPLLRAAALSLVLIVLTATTTRLHAQTLAMDEYRVKA